MAGVIERAVCNVTMKAGQDLRSSQYCFVAISGSEAVMLCRTSGEDMMGILQNQPYSGDNAVVMVMGVSKIKAGGSVTRANPITTNHSGMGVSVTLTSGQYVLATALETMTATYLHNCIVQGPAIRAQ